MGRGRSSLDTPAVLLDVLDQGALDDRGQGFASFAGDPFRFVPQAFVDADVAELGYGHVLSVPYLRCIWRHIGNLLILRRRCTYTVHHTRGAHHEPYPYQPHRRRPDGCREPCPPNRQYALRVGDPGW